MSVGSAKHHHVRRAGLFLILAALAAMMVGCVELPSKDLEIRTWYDLDAVRRNLSGNHRLMNDLDATTAGYEELAGPAANDGKGWEPIGPGVVPLRGRFDFRGRFDGQGHEIRDLFINRSDQNRIGLFGSVLGGRIQDVGVVDASVIGYRMVGGLVGDGSKMTVTGAYVSGDVAGSEIVGGLIGYNFYGTVRNSYSTASVSGKEHVGGLVAKNTGTVENCYSIGRVTGDESVGGLVGAVDPADNSFWDVEASRIQVSVGGTGKTTAEMMHIATFADTDTEGLDEPWDIIAVAPGQTDPDYTWNIVDGQTYPFLSWQPIAVPNSS